jgi:hypothetical protein
MFIMGIKVFEDILPQLDREMQHILEYTILLAKMINKLNEVSTDASGRDVRGEMLFVLPSRRSHFVSAEYG